MAFLKDRTGVKRSLRVLVHFNELPPPQFPLQEEHEVTEGNDDSGEEIQEHAQVQIRVVESPAVVRGRPKEHRLLPLLQRPLLLRV